MTSRELIDSIDELISRRINQSHGQPPHTTAIDEQCENIKRDIADALKRLDQNGGVFFSDGNKVK